MATGVVSGTYFTEDGRAVAGSLVSITGGTGIHTSVRSDAKGRFFITLPYGRYSFLAGARVAAAAVFVAPLQTTRLNLIQDSSGRVRSELLNSPREPGIWTDQTRGRVNSTGFHLLSDLLSREPAIVTEPLNFTGTTDNRLGVASQRGFSWTFTQFKFQGMDATDAYQPGRPNELPNTQALDAVVVRSAFAQSNAGSSGTEIGAFFAEPRASWHFALTTDNTGAALSSSNLPPISSRGLVQQADQFRWFTGDSVEVGGALTRWADVFASARGQWASQAMPLSAPGTDQQSRLLYGNIRGRVRAGASDRFDALYSGSRIDLSSGGIPAGIEALTSNRMEPSFTLPGGFASESETDHLDFVQLGWTHFSSAGAIEVRYGYSTAHLDTGGTTSGQSRIELLGGAVTGSPPLANLAVRPRHEIAGSWQPQPLQAIRMRHQLAVGGGWKRSLIRNRFTTPSDSNLITVAGRPAMMLQFNTPLDSRELIHSSSLSIADHISVTHALTLDLGALADFSRGSLPPQSSPAGAFAPARIFAAQADLIAWNSVSPRAGFAWQLPRAHGFTLRGTYLRLYAPLAGRYLDFGNPNSLGGSVWQWNGTAPGTLLSRFGGPYSSISPALQRPYSDEIDLGAQMPLTRFASAGVHLFRRDDKSRLAAIDTGLGAQAYSPVTILDPGPDGIPGTYDDQRLTVYEQNPATLGQDHYLLTNPLGLRMQNTGMLAEAGAAWRQLLVHASFLAEKSYGPTNSGDAVYENDPGVTGTLLMDPNTTINSTGRSYVDRAYVGKVQAAYRTPPAWGGIDLSSVADYMDGLSFARQLLVTGLPQGPFLFAATARGSVNGGNRAEYVLNWNLRVSREVHLMLGTLQVSADLMNLSNAGQKVQEADLTGPAFNQRLPVAIQAPRFVRIGLRYEF